VYIPATFFAHTKSSTTSRSHKPDEVPDTDRSQKEPAVRCVYIERLRTEGKTASRNVAADGGGGNGTVARSAGYREDETCWMSRPLSIIIIAVLCYY
jgi:hypothetical protein